MATFPPQGPSGSGLPGNAERGQAALRGDAEARAEEPTVGEASTEQRFGLDGITDPSPFWRSNPSSGLWAKRAAWGLLAQSEQSYPGLGRRSRQEALALSPGAHPSGRPERQPAQPGVSGASQACHGPHAHKPVCGGTKWCCGMRLPLSQLDLPPRPGGGWPGPPAVWSGWLSCLNCPEMGRPQNREGALPVSQAAPSCLQICLWAVSRRLSRAQREKRPSGRQPH